MLIYETNESVLEERMNPYTKEVEPVFSMNLLDELEECGHGEA